MQSPNLSEMSDAQIDLAIESEVRGQARSLASGFIVAMIENGKISISNKDIVDKFMSLSNELSVRLLADTRDLVKRSMGK